MSRVIFTVCIYLVATAAAAAISVTAEADRTTVRVGDRVHIKVEARRSADPAEPIPSHAGLQIGPEWSSGAQTAESERADANGFVKIWHFELLAVSETTSVITPVVILSTPPPGEPPLATNRVLGAPLSVTIKSELVRPWWLPHPLTLGVIAGLAITASLVVRAIRHRRLNRPRPVYTPYQEAMAMMQEVHANCREDRAIRFFVDVERVLTGYLSRRSGRPLGSATATEIAALAEEYVRDSQTVADLRMILQRCTTVRFSGAKADFGGLAETEELTRSVLERLELGWVTDSSADETSTEQERT